MPSSSTKITNPTRKQIRPGVSPTLLIVILTSAYIPDNPFCRHLILLINPLLINKPIEPTQHIIGNLERRNIQLKVPDKLAPDILILLSLVVINVVKVVSEHLSDVAQSWVGHALLLYLADAHLDQGVYLLEKPLGGEFVPKLAKLEDEHV